MPEISGYETQHIKNLLKYSKRIDEIYRQVIDEITAASRGLKPISGKPFSFDDYPLLKKKANRLFAAMADELLKTTEAGVRSSWSLSNEKNDQLVKMVFKDKSVPEKVAKKIFGTNLQAMDQFINRKEEGMGLSDRVWNYTGQFRFELETGMQTGITEGIPATKLAGQMKQYLNQPDMLFRRVRDAKGKLHLSKRASEYHPGQGVYRSSYKNALRMTRTEMNLAYRNADHERWKQMDFILGFEVKLSNRHKVEDICDALAGKYPKDFKYNGWHTQCLCPALPILPSEEERIAYLTRPINGEGSSFEFKGKISNVPSGFNDWIGKNTDRVKGWKSTPYFIKDNFKGGDITKGLKIKTAPAKSSTSNDLYSKIKDKENIIRKNKRFETAVAFDDDGNILFEKKGGPRSVSFTPKEVAQFENTIFTHNHPSGHSYPEGSILRIGNSFSAADIILSIRNNIKEIRAVTPNYTFSMKRPSDGWPDIGSASRLIETITNSIREDFNDRIRRGILSERMASVMHHHSVWKQFSEKTGCIYTKTRDFI